MPISKLHGLRTAVHMVEPASSSSPPPLNNVPDDDDLSSAAQYVKSSVETVWNGLNSYADTIPAEFGDVLAKCHSADDFFENGLDAAETLLREKMLGDFSKKFCLMVLVQIVSHYLFRKGELTLEDICGTYEGWSDTFAGEEKTDITIFFKDRWPYLTQLVRFGVPPRDHGIARRHEAVDLDPEPTSQRNHQHERSSMPPRPSTAPGRPAHGTSSSSDVDAHSDGHVTSPALLRSPGRAEPWRSQTQGISE